MEYNPEEELTLADIVIRLQERIHTLETKLLQVQPKVNAITSEDIDIIAEKVEKRIIRNITFRTGAR